MLKRLCIYIYGHLKGERLYLYIYSPWRLYYGRFFSVNSLMSSPWKRFQGIIIFVLWKFLCQFDTSYLENNFSVLIVVVIFKILTFSAPRHQISKFSCHQFNFRSATHCNVYIMHFDHQVKSCSHELIITKLDNSQNINGKISVSENHLFCQKR